MYNRYTVEMDEWVNVDGWRDVCLNRWMDEWMDG